MSIARYEAIIINTIVRNADVTGDATPTFTPFFNTAAMVFDVKNSLDLKEEYRKYSDLTNLRINFTPNAFFVATEQQNYAITWRAQTWRIVDTYESNDRRYIYLMCTRTPPSTRS